MPGGGPEITGVSLLFAMSLLLQPPNKQQHKARSVIANFRLPIADFQLPISNLFILCSLVDPFKKSAIGNRQLPIGNRKSYSSDSSTTAPSLCSRGSGSPGTRYSPSTHRPRSTSWQRSEQKGRKGLSFHSAGLPQVGHFMNLEATKTARTSTKEMPVV